MIEVKHPTSRWHIRTNDSRKSWRSWRRVIDGHESAAVGVEHLETLLSMGNNVENQASQRCVGQLQVFNNATSISAWSSVLSFLKIYITNLRQIRVMDVR